MQALFLLRHWGHLFSYSLSVHLKREGTEWRWEKTWLLPFSDGLKKPNLVLCFYSFADTTHLRIQVIPIQPQTLIFVLGNVWGRYLPPFTFSNIHVSWRDDQNYKCTLYTHKKIPEDSELEFLVHMKKIPGYFSFKVQTHSAQAILEQFCLTEMMTHLTSRILYRFWALLSWF